jgi:hypothetical protein
MGVDVDRAVKAKVVRRADEVADFLRGKNVRAWGNDPEHIHLWTAGQFRHMVGRYFEVEKVLYPFPWVLAECRA